MGTDTTSRASMDIAWQTHGAEGGKDRQTRKQNALDECQRKTAGAEAVAYYAAMNDHLVPEDTHLNIDFVNDGDGGFRAATTSSEAKEYGEARIDRVRGKLGDGHKTWQTEVFHLPYSMCEELPGYYVQKDDHGEPVLGPDGTPLASSRWVIKPGMEDEANRYFKECINYFESVLPDGHEGVHGGSINLDESRPHLHLMTDALMKDPRSKDPDHDLKNGFSLAFGDHRASAKIPAVDKKTGAPLIDKKTGQPKTRLEGARDKAERFHRELKQHMLDRGFDIATERDAVRHGRRVGLDDYKELKDGERVVEATTAALGDRETSLAGREAGIADREVEIGRRSRHLDDREQAVSARTEQVASWADEVAETAVSVTAGQSALRRQTDEIETRERELAEDRMLAEAERIEHDRQADEDRQMLAVDLKERTDAAVAAQTEALAAMMPEMVAAMQADVRESFVRQAVDDAPAAFVEAAKKAQLGGKDGQRITVYDYVEKRLGKGWDRATTVAQDRERTHALIESIRNEVGNSADRDRAAGREVDGGREM